MDQAHEFERELEQVIIVNDCNVIRGVVFTNFANTYEGVAKKQTQHLQNAKRQELHSRMASHKTGANVISKYLKGEGAKPLKHVLRKRDTAYGKQRHYIA